MTDKELYILADEARKRAYSPYSNITVGAALITDDGKVYTGTNIENAAYSPSVCAERVAIFSAINDGARNFVAIAVAGGKKNAKAKERFSPCGVCRQVMAEFCKSDFRVVLSEKDTVFFSDLLPYTFNGELIK